MQDLINEAVQRGKELYETQKRKEEEAKIGKDRFPLAMQWVTEELPDLVVEQISKDPERSEIQIKKVLYKNRVLSDELLAEACQSLGLKIRIERGFMKHYEECPLIDYIAYYVVL